MIEELCLPRGMPRIAGGVRLGIFQPSNANCYFPTTTPGATDGTYGANLAVLKLCDEIGMSFSLPVARWKRVIGEHLNWCDHGIDTIVLAAAGLQATKRLVIFSTVHTELLHPVIAAKLGADMDHVGRGRWGLNIVAGWSEPEFHSMGFQLRAHEDRYRHAQEWLSIVRELWLEGESSFRGEYFQLDGAECHPRPLQTGGPVVVNAGASSSGQRFALDNASYLFTVSPEDDNFRRLGDSEGSNVGYIGTKKVIVRRTRSEAETLAEDIFRGVDRLAMANQVGRPGRETSDVAARLLIDEAHLRETVMGQAIIGSPEDVGRGLAAWCLKTGVDGVCLTLFDYERELELLAEGSFEVLGEELAAAGKSLVLES